MGCQRNDCEPAPAMPMKYIAAEFNIIRVDKHDADKNFNLKGTLKLEKSEILWGQTQTTGPEYINSGPVITQIDSLAGLRSHTLYL